MMSSICYPTPCLCARGMKCVKLQNKKNIKFTYHNKACKECDEIIKIVIGHKLWALLRARRCQITKF